MSNILKNSEELFYELDKSDVIFIDHPKLEVNQNF